MLRTAPARGVVQSLAKQHISFASRRVRNTNLSSLRPISTSRSIYEKRPQCFAPASHKTTMTLLQRYATATKSLSDKIDKKSEAAIAKKTLEPHPDEVSVDSSVVQSIDMGSAKDRDVDMLAGVKADLDTIRETFALTEVPREAYYIGLAGVLPYLATSVSTVYLAWDINYAHQHGEGFLMSGRTAEALLHLIEPLQVGYGAVIISFLGAIHWGLEWAGYGGYHGYKRYAIGVIAPAVAWPTILFPIEYALITQFLAFNFLYFTDAQATRQGWCPPWYTTYRFILTFVVGASIVLSLIGRGQIAGLVSREHGPTQRLKELQSVQWDNLEKEERERRAKQVQEDEEGAEEEAEEGGEDGEEDDSE